MKLALITSFITLSISTAYAYSELPNNLKIYIQNNQVSTTATPGAIERNLPINNDYQANPACYMACYSHDKEKGIYQVGDGAYVNGLVRIAGIYNNRICIPGTPEELINLCKKIPTCINTECWVDGNTGAFYNIKEKPINPMKSTRVIQTSQATTN